MATRKKNTLNNAVDELTVLLDDNGKLTISANGKQRAMHSAPLDAKAREYFANRGHDSSQNRKMTGDEMQQPLSWIKLNIQDFNDEENVFVFLTAKTKGGLYFKEHYYDGIPAVPPQIKMAISHYVRPSVMRYIKDKKGQK